MDDNLSPQDVIDKIEEMIKNIIESFASTNDCTIQTTTGSVRFSSANSTITFGSPFDECFEYCPSLVDSKEAHEKENSAAALDNLSAILKIPRNKLNILAADRGIVYGNLKYIDNGGLVDCMQYGKVGKSISPHLDNLRDFSSDARFILVIEKESTLMRLTDDRFCEKYGPCIILTAKGNPDLGTRLFTKKLIQEFNIPVYYLGDWDPFGVQILLMYCVGSKKREHETDMFIPNIMWLGVHDNDLLNLPSSCFLPLSDKDIKKANKLLSHPEIIKRPSWQKELEIMIAKNRKAEIQALSNISLSYLSDTYPVS